MRGLGSVSLPWSISLTPSGARRRPSSPGLDSVAMPPRNPQRTMEKTTWVMVHDHFWLYLE